MGQTWRHLLFAHWPIDPEALDSVLPENLAPDVREGTAWVGVTPFLIEGLRARLTPPLPLVSRFPEINVRTYVTVDGKPGIYFLSLDTSSCPAIWAARHGYRLPYFRAEASLDPVGDGFRVLSARSSLDGPAAELECVYEPLGSVFRSAPGSLEAFLTERYCLYTFRGRILHRAEIHHPAWRLRHAGAQFMRNTMAVGYGLNLLVAEPLLHYAARQDVVLWPLTRV